MAYKKKEDLAPVVLTRKVITDFDIQQFEIFMEPHYIERVSDRFGEIRYQDVPSAMKAYGATGPKGGVVPSVYEEFMQKLNLLTLKQGKRDFAQRRELLDREKEFLLENYN